jgi:hypothetical protein
VAKKIVCKLHLSARVSTSKQLLVGIHQPRQPTRDISDCVSLSRVLERPAAASLLFAGEPHILCEGRWTSTYTLHTALVCQGNVVASTCFSRGWRLEARCAVRRCSSDSFCSRHSRMALQHGAKKRSHFTTSLKRCVRIYGMHVCLLVNALSAAK